MDKYPRSKTQKDHQKLKIAAAILFGFFLGQFWSSSSNTSSAEYVQYAKLEREELSLTSVAELCRGYDSEVHVPKKMLYFSPHQKYWEETVIPFVHQKVKQQGHIKVLELGIMVGSSTHWIIKNMIAPFPGSQYIGIDMFLEENRAYFCQVNGNNPLAEEPMMLTASTTVPGLIELAGFIYRYQDKASLRYRNPKLFDIIYVDAGHTGSEVFFDIALSWALLKTGGLMVLDDYDIVDYWTPETPKLVMDPFLHAFAPYIEKYWIADNQVFLIKSHDAIFGSFLFKNVTL